MSPAAPSVVNPKATVEDQKQALSISKQIAADAQRQKGEREKIMNDLQGKIFELTKDVTVRQSTPDSITPVAFSTDGHWLTATSPSRHDVLIWDLSAKDLSTSALPLLRLNEETLISLAFHPTLPRFAAVCATPNAKRVRTWDLTVRGPIELTRVLTVPGAGEVSSLIQSPLTPSLAFSGDGKWLAANDPEAVVLWPLGDRPERKDMILAYCLAGCPSRPNGSKPHGALDFSPDGRWLYFTDADAKGRLFNLRAGPEPTELTLLGQADAAGRTPFSGDGKWLATQGSDGAVHLWDLSELSASHPS